jgi:hypothetical protein
MDKSDHFWPNAPTLGWASKIWRKITFSKSPPSILPPSPTMPFTSMPKSPYNTTLQRMTPEKSATYATFLEKNFYSAGSVPVTLRIPDHVIKYYLENNSWIGVELVSSASQELIAIVISKGAGYIGKNPCGIVDYLCVAQRYRRLGMANTLLRALYVISMESEGRAAQFFKKEGGFNILPYIALDTYIGRKTNGGYTPSSVSVHKLQNSDWAKYVNILRHEHGLDNTIILANHTPTVESELFVISYRENHVIYRPTWEYGPGEQKGRAIIVAWYSSYETIIENVHDNDEGRTYDTIVDCIPCDYVYAPSNVPRSSAKEWRTEGSIGTYAFHVDPGTPFEKSLYSAITS